MRYNRFEYPANRAGDILAPCLKVEKPDELVNLELTFVSQKIEGDHFK